MKRKAQTERLWNMIERVSGKIRSFRANDIQGILELEGDAFPKSAYPKEVLLNYAFRFPESFVVLEIEDGIGGYIIYDVDGHIHSMAVKSSHRRRGFGTRLFMQALEHVNDILWLEVRSKNHGAMKFYTKMGMHIVGKVAEYYEGDDALIMLSDLGNLRKRVSDAPRTARKNHQG